MALNPDLSDRDAAIQAFLAAKKRHAAAQRKLDGIEAERSALLQWVSGSATPLLATCAVQIPIGGGCRDDQGRRGTLDLSLVQSATCGVGGIVWSSSTAVATWIADDADARAAAGKTSERLRVVELGCGVGAVAGFSAAAHGHNVVATDIDPIATSTQLRTNLEANASLVTAHHAGGSIQVVPLEWSCAVGDGSGGGEALVSSDDGTAVSFLHGGTLEGPIDLLLAADVLYAHDPLVLVALADTATRLLARSPPGARFVLAFPSRRPVVEEAFVEVLCRQASLEVQHRRTDDGDVDVDSPGRGNSGTDTEPMPPSSRVNVVVLVKSAASPEVNPEGDAREGAAEIDEQEPGEGLYL